MRRYRLWAVVALGLIVIGGGWLSMRPAPAPARIVTFGSEERLALEPESIIVLEFTKPVPTGIAERQAILQQPGLFPEFLSDWHRAVRFGELLSVSEKKVILKVHDLWGPDEISYRSQTGEWYRLAVYIPGEPDLDRFVASSRPLPRDGSVPIGKGTFGLKVRGANLMERASIAVRDFWRRRLSPAPAAVAKPPVPAPQTYELFDGTIKVDCQWSRMGNVLRLHMTLHNPTKKRVAGARLNRLQMGKQSPQGVVFPVQWQAIEPGQSLTRTFDFPGGDPEGSLASEWETATQIIRSE
jgi:hypothetical protein